MAIAIAVENVQKSYGTITALAGIDFVVQAGECFGLLGPNGAGKSTLIRIISTLEMAQVGEITVAGYSATREAMLVRQKIGVALQETGVDPLMTGHEILMLTARLFGANTRQARIRTDRLLERMQLTDLASRKVRTYSGGMRRRLDLATALVNEPEIVILDEPTTGLDPTNRLALWDILRALSHEDHRTVLISTQYLEEADALCDRVLFMNHGSIVAQGTPSDLKREMGYSVIRFSAEKESDRLVAFLIGHEFDCKISGPDIELYSKNPEEEVFRLRSMLESESLTMRHLEIRPPSLDDVFLHLTRGDRDEEAATHEVLA